MFISKKLSKIMFILCFTYVIGANAENNIDPQQAKKDKAIQVYHTKDFFKTSKTNVASGTGNIEAEYAFSRNKYLTSAFNDCVIKEIAYLTLEPGASIGLHQHTDNEDSYIIISGTGVFIDGNKKETPVKVGDVTIARKTQWHGLKNTGKEPLVILDIIAQK